MKKILFIVGFIVMTMGVLVLAKQPVVIKATGFQCEERTQRRFYNIIHQEWGNWSNGHCPSPFFCQERTQHKNYPWQDWQSGGCFQPTPTPTVEVTPTPTINPCDQKSDLRVQVEEGPYPEVDPCVTPTPEPTPVPCTGNCGGWSPRPEGEKSTTEAPQCTSGTTMKVPANVHVVRNGSEATVNFFVTEGDRAHVYWSVVGQPHWGNSSAQEYPNGVPMNGDKFVSYTVKGLDPTLGYDFGASQHNGCGGGNIESVTAVVVDGPAPQLFRLSYYE